jgi:hypothetical protein
VAADESFPASVDGWRVFGRRGDDLVAPFVAYIAAVTGGSPDGDVWRRGPNFSRCKVGDDHLAPGDDCTCGFRGTESLAEMLDFTRAKSLPGGSASILKACGVVARVKLWGRVRPGVAIGVDDPPTTWRASQARVLELHLAPEHTAVAEALHVRYGVPVVTYDQRSWPQTITPVPVAVPVRSEDAYLAAVRAAGFGRMNMARVDLLLNGPQTSPRRCERGSRSPT